MRTDGLEVGVRLAPQPVTDGKDFDLIARARVEVLQEDAGLRHFTGLKLAWLKEKHNETSVLISTHSRITTKYLIVLSRRERFPYQCHSGRKRPSIYPACS